MDLKLEAYEEDIPSKKGLTVDLGIPRRAE